MLENIQRILVPVAFDSFSKEELITADNFCRRNKAELHILHTYQDIFKVLSMRTLDLNKEQVEDTLRTEVQEDLKKLCDSVSLQSPVVTAIRKGDTTEQIIQYAKEAKIDLIVIATHGRAGLESFFMGSVAQKVVRYAPCPVLTLRGYSPDGND